MNQVKPLNRMEALVLVKDSITQIIPDAGFIRVRPDDRSREVLVKILSERTALSWSLSRSPHGSAGHAPGAVGQV